VSPSGLVTRLQAGTIELEIYDGYNKKRWEEYVAPPATNIPVLTGVNNAVNSVLKAIKTSLDAAIIGKIPDTQATLNAFYASTGNSSQSMWMPGSTMNTPIANTNRLYSSVDFSCVPVMSSGVLISPRHLLICDHSHGGDSYTFRKTDGSTVTANVIRGMSLGSDIYVKYLDTSLEAACTAGTLKPAKCLPTNQASYMPQLNGTNPYPIVAIKFRWATDVNWVSSDPSHDNTQRIFILQNSQQKSAYNLGFSNSYVSTNDSGSPTFYILDISGTPTAVLRGVFYTGGEIGFCPNSAQFGAEFDTAMNTLKDGGDATVYALSRVSFAQYTTP
jgi:hypothetical protein